MVARKPVAVVILLLAPALFRSGVRAEPLGVFGRVRISRVHEDDREAVRKTLEKRLVGRRIVSLRPREGEPGRYDATIYDYTVQKVFELVVDASGAQLSRRTSSEQPPLGPGELDDAMKVVETHSPWAEGIAQGTHRIYAPMPATTIDKEGRRLVNVGIMRPTGFLEAAENEIVSVDLSTGRIVRYPEASPPTGLATSFVCGPPEVPGGAPVGPCGALTHYEWPAANPVWKFDVMHPKCTQSVQPSGTGLELQNVFYRDHLVLARADVPVLNVRYANDTCGPFRDWLFAENCFAARGTQPSPGILVTDGTPPTTFCENGTDDGVFKGVAVHDEGNALWVVSEMDAGHYRYVMEWRLFLDGTIQPIFGFGATSDSCTCNLHFHNVYWRFEFALDGVAPDFTTGINTLERRVPGTLAEWSPVSREAVFNRPTTSWTEDWWRVRNPATGGEYVLKPGPEDGSAQGVDYARGDVWALAYNPGQIDDPNTGTAIQIDGWLSNESLGTTKRLVLWYRAGFTHDWEPSGTETCHYVGPTIEPARLCPALVTLDHEVYGCGSAVGVTVEDPDLVGAGSLQISVRSTTETAPETLSLTETPAWSGRFTGTMPTWSGAPANDDGKLSVSDADTVAADYLDASSCGNANVSVEKTARVDCAPPAISNVGASAVTDTSAVLTWTTDEPASSSVAYGASLPPATTLEDPASYTNSHAIPVGGLGACTTYWFSVGATDRVGNAATDTNLGSYYSFTTAGRAYVLGPDEGESGPDGWQATGPSGTVWHLDTCRSASPPHAWKAGGAACPGSYGNGADTYLTSPVLSLGPSGHGVHLRFKEYYQTQAGHDFCRPQVSVDGGATWTTLTEYSGDSGTWLFRDIDLAAFTGSNARVRFWFHTDLSTVAEGWYVDDVEVSKAAPCGASLLHASHTLADHCSAGGTSNGTLDPGERGVLTLVAGNAGLSWATHVAATLSSATPGVTVLGGPAAFPDVPPGGSAASVAPHFTFVVGTGVACPGRVDFTVHFTSDQGSWTDSFSVGVGGTGGTVTTDWAATDVPRPIPDFPGPPALTTIHVTDPGTVTDVDVGLTIQHTFDADLDLFLIGPTGARVELSTDNGGSGNNFTGTVFDDEATRPITGAAAPFAGSYRPEGRLADLDGIPAAGGFTLEVTDDSTSGTGTVTSWFLRLTAREPSCTPCPAGGPA